MALNERSLKALVGVNPALVSVVKLASTICAYEILVVEGVRTLEKQKEYFAKGKSKTMRSRHLTGHAVDLCPVLDIDGDGDKELSWDAKHFKPVAVAMKSAANKLGVQIEWGGDWVSFVDMPHFQLPWDKYS